MTPFREALERDVAAAPIAVADYMARCNAHYYGSREPFGRNGDFVTAPEISQLFGELIGAWLADQWLRAGSPTPSRLVELGPGRGTMMADMLRSMAAARWLPEVVFVDVAAAHPRDGRGTVSRADVGHVADDRTTFFVANEFFDALPVRQFERTATGWRERMVAAANPLAVVLDANDATASLPTGHGGDPVGSIVETSPEAVRIAAEIGARLRRHGGAALFIDYGHAGPKTGDTLQAVRGHVRADPFADPGDADLTCHVDFTALAVAAAADGRVRAWGPVGQGAFLRALGIDARAAALNARATAAQAADIDAAVARLTAPEAMGTLFKVMALTPVAAGAKLETPPGFA